MKEQMERIEDALLDVESACLSNCGMCTGAASQRYKPRPAMFPLENSP